MNNLLALFCSGNAHQNKTTCSSCLVIWAECAQLYFKNPCIYAQKYLSLYYIYLSMLKSVFIQKVYKSLHKNSAAYVFETRKNDLQFF